MPRFRSVAVPRWALPLAAAVWVVLGAWTASRVHGLGIDWGSPRDGGAWGCRYLDSADRRQLAGAVAVPRVLLAVWTVLVGVLAAAAIPAAVTAPRVVRGLLVLGAGVSALALWAIPTGDGLERFLLYLLLGCCWLAAATVLLGLGLIDHRRRGRAGWRPALFAQAALAILLLVAPPTLGVATPAEMFGMCD